MKSIHLSDYEQIEEVIKLYLEGCKNGDDEIMKPAFIEKATINGNPIQTLYDGIVEAGESEVEARIDLLDAENNVAVVKVTMENYFGDNYIDFHTLIKDKNEWKIVAKVFTEF